MFWREKRIPCGGAVQFRGSIPPRLGDFDYLRAQGITVAPKEAALGQHWCAQLDHAEQGSIEILCPREFPVLPANLIDFAMELVPSEKALAALGRSGVILRMQGVSGDLLRDRKRLLWYLRQVMGEDGVVAFDHTALRLWSRGALDDELCHDADLDIESLFALHPVSSDGNRIDWLHTHGLAELGMFDFDILNPCEDLLGVAGMDILRAIALAIFEGGRERMGQAWPLVMDGRTIRFVPAREFNRRAAAAYRQIRNDDAGEHVENRAVVCNPAKGMLARWLQRPAPVDWLSQPLGDHLLINFSTSATRMMAERATQTYGLLRRLADEFAEFQFSIIIKLCYGEDDHGENGEHMWFQVHEMHDDHVDATLLSQPFYCPDMQEGDRGTHPLNRITDWAIMTPGGMITPRNTTLARMIRERREELREAMRANSGEA